MIQPMRMIASATMRYAQPTSPVRAFGDLSMRSLTLISGSFSSPAGSGLRTARPCASARRATSAGSSCGGSCERRAAGSVRGARYAIASMKPETATEMNAYASQSDTAGSSESVGERSCRRPAAVVMITMDACTTDSVGMSERRVSQRWRPRGDGRGGERIRTLDCEAGNGIGVSGVQIRERGRSAYPVAKYFGSGMMLRMISTWGAGVTACTNRVRFRIQRQGGQHTCERA